MSALRLVARMRRDWMQARESVFRYDIEVDMLSISLTTLFRLGAVLLAFVERPSLLLPGCMGLPALSGKSSMWFGW